MKQPPEDPGYRRALVVVACINLGVAGIEVAAALLGDSRALLADAVDFLEDGISVLLVLRFAARGPRARGWIGLTIAALEGIPGLVVLGTVAWSLVVPHVPQPSVMGPVALGALAANLACAALLLPHRGRDVTARAVWLSSRNDVLNNVAVLAAALLVAWTGSHLPDLVAAAVMGVLYLQAAIGIARGSVAALRAPSASTLPSPPPG